MATSLSRDDCPVCQGTGHVQSQESWERCQCLIEGLTREQLGVLFAERPRRDTKLVRYVERDVLLVGPVEALSQHLTGALLEINRRLERDVRGVTAAALFQAWRDTRKDSYGHEGFRAEKYHQAENTAFLVLMLNVNEHSGGQFPATIGKMVVQLLDIRREPGKSTWVVAVGVANNQIAGRYGITLAQVLTSYKLLEAKSTAPVAAAPTETEPGSTPPG